MLALIALTFIIVGSNCAWWVIFDVGVKSEMFTELGLPKESYRFFLEMGLDHIDVRFHVKHEAMEKGFYARTDSYLWGILSQTCSKSIPHSACEARSLITSLSSAMYILLSISSLSLAAAMGTLVLAPSPILSFKTITSFYSVAAALCLSALAIFEFKIRGVLTKPDSWGIWDEKIHSTFAGVDELRSIPKGSSYTGDMAISRIMVWTAFGCIITSFIFYVIRVYSNRRNKTYLNSYDTIFKSRPSLFVSAAEETLSGRRMDDSL